MGGGIGNYIIHLPTGSIGYLVQVRDWGNKKRMGNPILRYLIRVHSID